MEHATDQQHKAYVSMAVKHELVMRAKKYQHQHLLSDVKTELSVVMTLKEAFEEIGPLGSRKKLELLNTIDDIQNRAFRHGVVVQETVPTADAVLSQEPADTAVCEDEISEL